jgi:predicted dehydrogenase
MSRDNALHKLDLLRRVRPENGSTESEVENARRLANKLIQRHGLDQAATQPRGQSPESRLSWVYWEHIASEHCATLSHFGTRGSISLEAGKTMVLINLASGDWQVKRRSPAGFQIVHQSNGLESFRTYMNRNAPRMYSLFRR